MANARFTPARRPRNDHSAFPAAPTIKTVTFRLITTPATHLAYLPGASFREMYPLDVARARELMAEAGYASGFTLGEVQREYVQAARVAGLSNGRMPAR